MSFKIIEKSGNIIKVYPLYLSLLFWLCANKSNKIWKFQHIGKLQNQFNQNKYLRIAQNKSHKLRN